jgi:hypothetical protein
VKPFLISRAHIERRWLVPIYLLNRSPIAWECAACGKLFSRSLEEEKRPGLFSPADVLERVFEGGIVIDAFDRLSAIPGSYLLEDTKSLHAELVFLSYGHNDSGES